MQGSVMARKAFLIDHFFVVKTQIGQMAGRAFLGENGVRSGQSPGGVHPRVAANAVQGDSQDG
jgi:hypothetical protein